MHETEDKPGSLWCPSESTQALSGERAPCFAQGRVRVFTCFYIGLLGIEKQLLRMTI